MSEVAERLNRRWNSNEDVALRYGVPIKTVLDWRHRGVGPKGVKFGRHVRYSEEALQEWERERARASA